MLVCFSVSVSKYPVYHCLLCLRNDFTLPSSEEKNKRQRFQPRTKKTSRSSTLFANGRKRWSLSPTRRSEFYKIIFLLSLIYVFPTRQKKELV